jgi:hypothetical protein
MNPRQIRMIGIHGEGVGEGYQQLPGSKFFDLPGKAFLLLMNTGDTDKQIKFVDRYKNKRLVLISVYQCEAVVNTFFKQSQLLRLRFRLH